MTLTKEYGTLLAIRDLRKQRFPDPGLLPQEAEEDVKLALSIMEKREAELQLQYSRSKQVLAQQGIEKFDEFTRVVNEYHKDPQSVLKRFGII